VVFVAVIGEKIGRFTLMDALGVAAGKVVLEKVLDPITGNSSIKSGLMKGVLAVVLDKVAGDGKIATYAKTGLVVDAGEDVVIGLLSGNLMGVNPLEQAQQVISRF
jgi:hypothetical protein